jgi:hypothetical protein
MRTAVVGVAVGVDAVVAVVVAKRASRPPRRRGPTWSIR